MFKPTTLDVYSTPKCNMSCAFCRRQNGESLPIAPDFKPVVAVRVLDMFPSITGACVAGFGEPLMNQEIPAVIDTIIARGIYVGFITNGTLVHDRFNEIVWSKLGYVNVSVNSTSPSDAVLCGIVDLLSSGAKVSISFVVDNSSWRHIPQYLQLASKLKVSNVSIVNILPHHPVADENQNVSFWNRVITYKSSEYFSILPDMKALAKSLGVNVGHWPVAISREECPWRCKSPWTNIGVDGAGNVSACNRVVGPVCDVNLDDSTWKCGAAYFRGAVENRLSTVCTMCFGNWV